VFDEFPIEVHVVHEPEIRGTAGGVAGARMLFGDAPILVHNGDILTDPPVTALLEAAEGGGLVLGVARRPAGTGTVGLDGEGNVVRLRGERFGEEQARGDYVGVLAVGRRCLDALPERGCLIGDVALPELREGGSIGTVAAPGAFHDTGDLAGYLVANFDWLRRQGVQCWVGEGARVASGVELVDSVVGSRAEIVGAGRVERVVVWPGAVAQAPLSDAVVMTSGRVVLKH
jgi:mannose-1-phosphate guanylyltransferase